VPKATQGTTANGPQIKWAYNGMALDMGGANDVIVEGVHFNFTSTDAGHTSSACIGASSAAGQNISIRNCTTQRMVAPANQLRYFINLGSGTMDHWTVEDCVVDVATSAITAASPAWTKVLRNVFKKSNTGVTPTPCLSFSGTATEVEVSGNLIHPTAVNGLTAGDGTGFTSGVTFSAVSGVMVRGNRVETTRSSAAGVVIASGTGASITENTIVKASAGGSVVDLGTASACLVEGNSFTFGGTTAITANTGSDNKFCNNYLSLTLATANGISATTAQRLTITGNNIVASSTAGAGVTISGAATGIIDGNTVNYNSGGTAFSVASTSLFTISNNTATGVATCVNAPGSAHIVGNTFSSFSSQAAFLGSASTFNDNYVTMSSGSTGVTISTSSTDVSVCNNKFAGTCAIVVNVVGSNSRCTISGNQGNVSVTGIAFTCGASCAYITLADNNMRLVGSSPTTLVALLDSNGGTNFSLTGNTFVVANVGVGNKWTTVLDMDSSSSVLSNNRLDVTTGGDLNSYKVLSFTGGSDYVVSGLEISSTSGDAGLTQVDTGIYIENTVTDISISGANVDTDSSSNLTARGDNMTFADCHFPQAALLDDTANRVSMSNCYVGNGLAVESDNTMITNCQLIGSSDSGGPVSPVWIRSTALGVTLRGCNIEASVDANIAGLVEGGTAAFGVAAQPTRNVRSDLRLRPVRFPVLVSWRRSTCAVVDSL
jgi:hypothetical protein